MKVIMIGAVAAAINATFLFIIKTDPWFTALGWGVVVWLTMGNLILEYTKEGRDGTQQK